MQWCTEGSETYPKRLELIQKQKLECEKEIKRMEKALAMLKFKCWYYETALADGNEDRIHEMLPDRLPEEIQAYYDASHTDWFWQKFLKIVWFYIVLSPVAMV